MIGASHLAALVSTVCGYAENIYIQLHDCCAYTTQSAIVIIDRNNTEYTNYTKLIDTHPEESETLYALGLNVRDALIYARTSVIVVSKSVFAYLVKAYTIPPLSLRKFKPYDGWNIKELEDFYILTPSTTDKTVGLDMVKKYSILANQRQKKAIAQILQQIFATPTTDAVRPLPLWMVYFVGHGDSGKIITGLSIDEFKTCVDFFQHAVATKIFIYNSCYAGGINKLIAFKKDASQVTADEQLLQKSYSFPIVIVSSSDASYLTPTKMAIRFDILFTGLAKKESSVLDYYDIFLASNSIKVTTQNWEEQLGASNFIQVRMPGLESFSIEALIDRSKQGQQKAAQNNHFFVISKTMARTREQPLKIGAPVKIIFVYSAVVPFALELKQPVPRIVFMDPSDVYHFKKLDASTVTFEQLCKICAPLDPILPKKISIDELIFNDNGTIKRLTNALLEMRIPTKNSKTFTFMLKSLNEKEYFSAETDPEKLPQNDIEIKNVRKGTAQDASSFTLPQAIGFTTMDNLKKVIGTKAR